MRPWRIEDWLRFKDKSVTRQELWDFVRRYEAYRRRNVWWRRLWRWLLGSFLPDRDELERAAIERKLEASNDGL